MKKILSILLVLILALGLMVPAVTAESTESLPDPVVPATDLPDPVVPATDLPESAPPVEPLTLGFSIQSTMPASGTPTTNAPGEILVNSTFSVTFDKSSFAWSIAGNNTYTIGNLVSSWVRTSGAVLGQDFSVDSIYVDSVSGSAVVTFKALREFSGTVTYYLDSSGAAANAATNSIQRTITVKNPPSGTSTILKTKQGGSAPYSTSHSGTIEINTGDKIYYVVPANNFEWTDGVSKDASTLTNTSWIKLRGASTDRDFEVRFTTAPNSSDVTITLTALKDATYSGFTLSMQGGGGQLTTPSAALNIKVKDTAVGSAIDGIASDSMLGGQNSGAMLNGKTITYSQLVNLDIKQGDEVLIPLYAGFFTWDGIAPYPGSFVTPAQLRRGRIAVGVSNRRGGNLLESGSPKIVSNNGAAYVSLKFSSTITTTNDVDFSIVIFLSVDRTRHNQSRLEIEGLFSPEIYYVNNSNTYFDISDGSIVEAEEFVRNAELYLGNGVSVITNLYQNKKYSGIAVDEISYADEENLNRFPTIDRIISIKSSTLNSINGKVKIDTDNINYYVYGAEGQYLGRSSGTLAYSHKYYLSTKEIDMRDIDIDTDINGDITIPDGDYIYDPIDGDNSVPPNINDIPGTGR